MPFIKFFLAGGGEGWVVHLVNLKSKTACYHTGKKWASSGIADNCNLGYAGYSKTTGKSGEQGRERLFYRERAELGGLFEAKIHWRKPGGPHIMASHLLGCDSLSLAGLLLERVEIFLPPDVQYSS